MGASGLSVSGEFYGDASRKLGSKMAGAQNRRGGKMWRWNLMAGQQSRWLGQRRE